MGGINNLARQEEQKEQESRSQNAKCRRKMVKITATMVKDSPKLINLLLKMCIENVLLIFDICTAKQLQGTHEWVI